MEFDTADSLFFFVDVQRCFAGNNDAGLVPRQRAFHGDLGDSGLTVWHINMRDKSRDADRQKLIDAWQAPLLPTCGQPTFDKTGPAPDKNDLFREALLEARPRLIVACGNYFDKCVEGTLAYAGNTLKQAGHDCQLAIVDDLTAPGFYKDRSTRRRWLTLRKPSGILLIDRADLILRSGGLSIAMPVACRPTSVAAASRQLTP